MIVFTETAGAAGNISELFQRISELSALTLSLTGGRVTIERDLRQSGEQPRSATLAARVKDMVDSARTVTLESLISMPFGSYGEVQKINCGFALDVDDSAPGFGIGCAIHEMWENYQAREILNDSWNHRFGPAHSGAIDVENAVVSELRGGRVARMATHRVRDGGDTYYVMDYHTTLVAIRQNGHGRRQAYEAAVIPPRIVETIQLYPGAVSVDTNAKAISRALKLLAENPPATAGISGPLATSIRDMIAVQFKQDVYLDGDPTRGLEKIHDKGQGADRGDLRAFVEAATPQDPPDGQIIIRGFPED
jgi:hypothetical protein